MLNNSAQTEYAEYCRSIWDDLPPDLKTIHWGMLPDELTSGQSHVALHDGKIINFVSTNNDLKIEFSTDHFGKLRKAWFHYIDAIILQIPNENVLGKQIKNGDSDVMCHEIEKTIDGEWVHTLLFASGEELIIQFKDFSLKLEDIKS